MAAHQAPPSLGFSRQEHWSGLPFPSPMHESGKWKWRRSVVSDPQQPHGLQPTRLLHPWDFPGKGTGVGCHCIRCRLKRDRKRIAVSHMGGFKAMKITDKIQINYKNKSSSYKHWGREMRIEKKDTFLILGSHAQWHVWSYFPDQVLNIQPLQWKCSLTTRLPGMFQDDFLIEIYLF